MNSIRVSVVSLFNKRVIRTITCREKSGVVVSQQREEKHDSRTSNPSKLSYGPGQGQHSRFNHSSYDMSTCSPHGPCVYDCQTRERNEHKGQKTKKIELELYERRREVPVRLRRPSSSNIFGLALASAIFLMAQTNLIYSNFEQFNPRKISKLVTVRKCPHTRF